MREHIRPSVVIKNGIFEKRATDCLNWAFSNWDKMKLTRSMERPSPAEIQVRTAAYDQNTHTHKTLFAIGRHHRHYHRHGHSEGISFVLNSPGRAPRRTPN